MSLSANYTVTETKDLNAQLGWTARAVQIDNITSSWIWVPAGGRFVPPFQYGVIVPLEGTQQGNIQWRTPVGIPVPTAGSATAQVTFMQEALPASNGQPVTIPSQQIPLPVSSINGLTGGSAATVGSPNMTLGSGAADTLDVMLTVPPGSNSLIIVGNDSSQVGAQDKYTFNVQGQTTFVEYVVSPSSGQGGAVLPSAFIVSSADDSIVRFFIGNVFARGATTPIRVVASFGTQAVAVQGNGTPLPINLTQVGGSALTAPTTNGVPVQTLPLGTPVSFRQTIAAAGTANILAAGSMLSNSLGGGIVGGIVTVDAAVATAILQIKDTAAAVVYFEASYQSAVVTPVPLVGRGAGDGGLTLVNGGSAQATFTGVVVYR